MTTTTLRSTLEMKGYETLASVLAVSQTLTYSIHNISNSSTDLDRDVIDLSKTLSGTTGSIDLTAAPLARQPAVTFDLTDDYLYAVQLYAPSANTGAITVKQGTTNGFPLLGAASLVILNPGDTICLLASSLTNKQKVDATHKTIDFAGTSGDSVKIVAYFDSNV